MLRVLWVMPIITVVKVIRAIMGIAYLHDKVVRLCKSRAIIRIIRAMGGLIMFEHELASAIRTFVRKLIVIKYEVL